MPLLLYAQAVMNGDEQTWEHLPSLAGNGTYLVDLFNHLLQNCDLESEETSTTLKAILPYCFQQIEPTTEYPIPSTFEFRLRLIRAVVANAQEAKKLTLLDQLIKHWLHGESRYEDVNKVIKQLHTKLVEARAELVVNANYDCTTIRNFSAKFLDWAINKMAPDDTADSLDSLEGTGSD